MNKPNIFKYATKELSQDAFIFWLLDHANPIYENVDKEINTCALNLIEFFFNLENKKMPETINKFELRKQEKSIDIVLYLNEFMIIIEDKVNTKSHSNQLFRYKSYAENKMGKENVLAIYFKTYDQSNYKKEEEDGFKIFHRQDLLELLNKTTTINNIFLDFRNYINSIQNEIINFSCKRIVEWDYPNWIGFFKFLQVNLGDGDWKEVYHKSGTLMIYTWNIKNTNPCPQYLQLEGDIVAIKINCSSGCDQKKHRIEYLNYYENKVKDEKLDFIKIKPHYGKTMTILKANYIVKDSENGLINLKLTIGKLKRYTDFLNDYYKRVC